MEEKKVQGSCISCNSRFPISVAELDDYMECPNCGEDATITTICPHCGQHIDTNGRAISCAFPCPTCGNEFVCNTLKTTDGSSMVVSMTGRVEMHDIASAVSIMQQQLDEHRKGSKQNEFPSNSKGCLSRVILVIGVGIALVAIKLFIA